jgi:hypothetical protein
LALPFLVEHDFTYDYRVGRFIKMGLRSGREGGLAALRGFNPVEVRFGSTPALLDRSR